MKVLQIIFRTGNGELVCHSERTPESGAEAVIEMTQEFDTLLPANKSL
jgi:hypothetical protein